MKILNIGGATAIIEHKGKRILFDPWLDDGIFHGSWYHYPPSNVAIKDLGHLDYVYISHIHEDHCSAGTIKHINRDAEIIVMEQKPNLVVNFLKANGFEFKKIHVIKPQTPEEISPGLIVDMVTADPAHELNFAIDSGLILNWDGFVIYNANDCPAYEAGMNYIKSTYKNIDLALLPYSAGSGYPACYKNLSDDEKISEKNRIFNNFIDSFMHSVQTLKPRLVMPFADQYVVAGSRSHLNKFMAHAPGPDIVIEPMRKAGLLDQLLLLNSGQEFDLHEKIKIPNEAYILNTEEARETYIRENLQTKKYDHEAFELGNTVPIHRLIQSARDRLWAMQERQSYFPDFKYYIHVEDKKRLFEIDLKSKKIEELDVTATKVQPYLALLGSATLITLMLVGHISWNIADAGLFIDYERVPNNYDPQIHAFINYLRL
jgi:UDP-MurNAc hydroxylase